MHLVYVASKLEKENKQCTVIPLNWYNFIEYWSLKYQDRHYLNNAD